MARHLRIEYPGALYHVMARGNDRRAIFETVEDRLHLQELLAEAVERYEIYLYAYVFMTTHYHLAIQTEHPNLHEFMHYLNTAYTVWANRRNRRTGHLFEGRYRAIVMEDAGYLLSATGYIHLNPVRVQGWYGKPVEEREERVLNYSWSSYRSYVRAAGKKSSPAVKCDRVWGELAAGSEREGHKRYREYILGWLKKEEAERRKPKKKREGVIFNPFLETRLGCYLGSDNFRDTILELLSKDRELSSEVVGHSEWRKDVPLSDLVGKIARMLEAPLDSLLRRRENQTGRDKAMYLCREVGQHGIREIGEIFGIEFSAASQAIKRVKVKCKGDKRFAKQTNKEKQAIINVLKTD